MVDAVALVPTEGVSLADIDAVLVGTLGATRSDGGRLARLYYDTFDGRLHRHGLVAEHEWLDGRAWLRVRRLGETTTLVQAAIDVVAGPVAALGDRRLRHVLEGPTGGRALLPVVGTEGQLARYVVTDGLDKTIVRVSVVTGYAEPASGYAEPASGYAEPATDASGLSSSGSPSSGSPSSADRHRHVLDPVITVSPVRGHDAAYHRAVAVVTTRLGERPAADPLVRAAGVAGLTLGVDPSDRSVALGADTPAITSLALLLCRFADVLESNAPGVISRLDDEFLHEFRVTLRSARAVVHAGRGLVAEAGRAELEDGLQALMRRSSPVRDLDVLCAAWATDEDFAPWLAALEDERRTAHAALRDALSGPQFAAVLDAMRAPPAPAATEGEAPPLTTAAWASVVVSDALRRLHRRARRAEPTTARPSAAEPSDDHAPLHATRKAAKRLRYLIDAFDSLDVDRDLRSLRRSLRHLQDTLGELQDTVVAVDAIERVAATVPDAPAAALLRLGQRSEQLRQQGQATAQRFAPSYRRLAKKRTEHAQRARRIGGAANDARSAP